ncbi:helix-turn-helix domain-containing protein [Cronobacter turicensis]
MNDKTFTSSHLNQSFPYSKALVDKLVPYVQFRRYTKGCKLPLLHSNAQMCYLIESGTFQIHRNLDNLLITTVPAPAIIGLGVHDIYLVTTEPSRIASLPLTEAHRLIKELGQWETLVQHMMVITNKLYTYSKQLSAPTAYELICNQLQELINEPEKLRQSVSVERYIRNKTRISRSSVMKILADLRAGGYIVIDEGRLISIKHLPLKY